MEARSWHVPYWLHCGCSRGDRGALITFNFQMACILLGYTGTKLARASEIITITFCGCWKDIGKLVLLYQGMDNIKLVLCSFPAHFVGLKKGSAPRKSFHAFFFFFPPLFSLFLVHSCLRKVRLLRCPRGNEDCGGSFLHMQGMQSFWMHIN